MAPSKPSLKILLNIALWLLITNIRTSKAEDYSNLLSSLYKQASGQDRPLVLMLDENSKQNDRNHQKFNNWQSGHDNHGKKDDKAELSSDVPYAFLYLYKLAQQLKDNNWKQRSKQHSTSYSSVDSNRPSYNYKSYKSHDRNDRNSRHNDLYESYHNVYKHGHRNDWDDHRHYHNDNRQDRNRDNAHIHSHRYDAHHDKYNDRYDHHNKIDSRNDIYSDSKKYNRHSHRHSDYHDRNRLNRDSNKHYSDGSSAENNMAWDSRNNNAWKNSEHRGDRYSEDSYRNRNLNKHDRDHNNGHQNSDDRNRYWNSKSVNKHRGTDRWSKMNEEDNEIMRLENEIVKSPIMKNLIKMSNDLALRTNTDDKTPDSCEEQPEKEATTDDPCEGEDNSCEMDEDNNISTRGIVQDHVSDPPPKTCD